MDVSVSYVSPRTDILTNLNQGKAADLKYVELAARMIADTVMEDAGRKIVVEKSTVPVKAAESISNILQHNIKPGI